MSDTQHSFAFDAEGVSSAGRAAHYRELADMHLKLGQKTASAEARASHLELAALWTRLAAQAEHATPALPEARPAAPSS